MRRWALVVVGSVMAFYLLLAFVVPPYVSSGDDAAIDSGKVAAQNGVVLDRSKVAKKRPSLGGKRPEKTPRPTPAPKVKKPKKSTKTYSSKKKKKERPDLLGPKKPAKPAATGAPATTAKPAASPRPAQPAEPGVEKPVVPSKEEMTLEELKAEIERLKVRIAELTTKKDVSEEEKAKAILELAVKQMEVMKQANKKQAELDFATAKDFYKSGRLKEAYEKAKSAVALDPDNAEYSSFLLHLEEQLRSVVTDSSYDLLEIEKVKQEQMVVEIRLLIDEAKSLYADATTMTGTDAVENLKKARMKLGHAEFMLNSISAAYRPQGIEKRIKDLIALVEDLLKQKVIEQKEYELKVAQEFADKISSWDEEYLIKRINNLINRAYLAIHREQYKQAELLLEKVIKLDPANREAKYLLRMVQKKGDAAAEKDIENRYDLELRRTLLRTKEYMIPYVDIIIYPDNWEEINRTRSAASEIKKEEVPEWQKLILAKMERKINITFNDETLTDAIDGLRDLIGVTIIVDPESADSVQNTITLDLKNMTFRTALEWVLRIAGLAWTLQDEAIYIATPDKIQGDKYMLIYDVRDLIGAVTHFAGPRITLVEEEGAAWEPPEEPDPEEQLNNLVEMIQSKIEPNSWDEAAGASISGREGKLIVTNVPRVHKKIEEMLDSFRKAQKLQVYINARFITVYNDFLEDIGVSWTGLDRDTTPDLRGIASNVPAGFASDPTDSTGGWDAYDWRGVILNNTSSEIGGLTTVPYQVGEGLNMQYALLGNFQAEVILNAIQKTRKGITLLAPRITVFNTQRAYMMVAREESYIADYEGLIATQAAILDPVIKTFTVGTILDVRPIISSDRKYITIEMRPTTATLIALRDYHINALLWGQDYPVYAPIIQLNKVRTTVVIPDNGVLLLGGQITSSHFRLSSGVPFLSKLPVIGRLFSHDAETSDNMQLLIFVNARIIMLEEIEERIKAR